MRRRRSLLAVAAVAAVALPHTVDAAPFPDVIALPTGFQPEGIAVGRGTTFYVGSLATGAVVRGDLRTGDLDVLVASAGGPAVGIEVDARNRVWVAGGPSGEIRVYDGRTGQELAVLESPVAGFLNDLVVTRDAVYVTNSQAPTLVVVPLGPGGSLPDPADVTTLELSGFPTSGPFNANGIEAWPTGELIVAHSAEQALYAVDPGSGDATAIDLGAPLPNVDGITRRGTTLYAVQNQLNRIAVVRLDAQLGDGEIVSTITDDDFAVPTTVAVFGDAVYAVNAKFGIADPANASYEVVRAPRT